MNKEISQDQIIKSAIGKLHLQPDDYEIVKLFMYRNPRIPYIDNYEFLSDFEGRIINTVFYIVPDSVRSYTQVGLVFNKNRRTISRIVRKAIERARPFV